MSSRALHILIAAALVASPAVAQRTLEIPREQIEALPANPLEDLNIDLSTPEGMFRAMEDIARTDWTGTLPEAVFEAIEGYLPLEAHVELVWGMEVSGSWTQSLSGTGSLNVISGSFGNLAGRQFHGFLDTPDREWPFQLFAMVPDNGPPVTRRDFVGHGQPEGGGGTGFGALANHMFDPDRIIGYATPTGMHSPTFTELADDYYYTEPLGGYVRVDERAGTYRLSFLVQVHELHSEGREPTGRAATLRGWACEAAAYAQNPDDCLYDPLEVIAYTPINQRENVNFRRPEITFDFSDPVDFDTLEDNVSLHTYGTNGSRIEVAGEIETRGETRFAFIPDSELLDATRYEVEISSGEQGVFARDGERQLEETTRWRFSTLVDALLLPADQRLNIDAYQTMRNAPLVIDKPTLLRIAPDWSHPDDIHPDWLVHSFPATLETDVQYLRLAAQMGGTPDEEGVFRVRHPEVFNDSHRLDAIDTINLFGWRPQWTGPASSIEILIEPYDPWPEPLDISVFGTEERFDNWPVVPRSLVIHYAYLEIGSWTDGVPPEVRPHANQILREAGEYSTQLFPVLSTRFIPIQIPGVDTTISQPFIDMDTDLTTPGIVDLINGSIAQHGDGASYVIARAAERLRTLLALNGQGGDGLMILYPLESYDYGYTEGLGEMFNLDMATRGMGMPIDVNISSTALAHGTVHEMGHAFGLHHNPADLSQLGGRVPWNHSDPGMEGFRLSLDGGFGWNKSNEHGNAQDLSILAPLMWPAIMPTNWAWLNFAEYGIVQSAFENRSGVSRFAALEDRQQAIRLAFAGDVSPFLAAQAPPQQAGNADGAESFYVIGSLHPSGTDATIDTVGRTHVTAPTMPGPYTAQLLDSRGIVLEQIAFGPSVLAGDPDTARNDHDYINPFTAQGQQYDQQAVPGSGVPGRPADADPDDPAFWDDFVLVLPHHPDAVSLVISDGEVELAARRASGQPGAIRFDTGRVDLTDGPQAVTWQAPGEGLRFDVHYSPDGQAPWQFLRLDWPSEGIVLDPETLTPGGAPTLRVTARDGLVQTSAELSVGLDMRPVPVITSADPVTARFALPVDPASGRQPNILDDEGSPIDADVIVSPDGRDLSIWPRAALDPEREYRAHLPAGFSDIHGNSLDEPFTWPIILPETLGPGSGERDIR